MAVDETKTTVHDERTAASLGRRRFLTLLGGAMFGVATRMVAPKVSVAAPTPPLCNGAPGCDTCNDDGVCEGCFNGPAYSCGGNQCWLVSTEPDSNGCRRYYNCCDWLRSDESTCICRSFAYTSCPDTSPPPPSAPPPTGGNRPDGIRVPGGAPAPSPTPAPSPSPSPSPAPAPSPSPPSNGRSLRGRSGGSPSPSPAPAPEPPTDGGDPPTRSIRR